MNKKREVEKLLIIFESTVGNKSIDKQLEIVSICADRIVELFAIPVVVGQSEQLCLNCKKEPATNGIGSTKTVCSKCWNSMF